MSKMYKVEIVTRPANFETLKVELGKIGVTSITFSNVHGCGLQKGHTELYRGVKKRKQRVRTIKDRNRPKQSTCRTGR
ncbi:hypothetical protein BsIDN1_64450 [Bacillus safensis]|uniref:Nitrogen regulatory protein P-II n=1 Tax=Bacillus safensis TaxID=561879 RepID=A0A5S9MH86_BACIA|nr:hypothetical protein BsIDN1_64450 [Bacillus safensis]